VGNLFVASRANAKAAGAESSTVVPSTAAARRTHSAAASATHSFTTRHDYSLFPCRKFLDLVFVEGFGDPFLENLDLFLQCRQLRSQIGSVVARIDIESLCGVLVVSPASAEAPASSMSEP